MKIYSKIEPGKLLHIINRKCDREVGRTDIVPPDQFIQCASLILDKDVTFRAHKHIERQREEMYIPQESWVVISGSVHVKLYDLDDTRIWEAILMPGDISITLAGGHNYIILEDGTEVLEFKTGPYLGQENDKVFI